MIALNVVSTVDINIENDLNNLENYIVSYKELLIMVAVIPHRSKPLAFSFKSVYQVPVVLGID